MYACEYKPFREETSGGMYLTYKGPQVVSSRGGAFVTLNNFRITRTYNANNTWSSPLVRGRARVGSGGRIFRGRRFSLDSRETRRPRRRVARRNKTTRRRPFRRSSRMYACRWQIKRLIAPFTYPAKCTAPSRVYANRHVYRNRMIIEKKG